MTRRLVFALASVFLLTGCAIAPTSDPSLSEGAPSGATCFAPEWQAEAYRDAVLAITEGARYDELTETERRSFLAAYNTARPPTGFLYERIGFFEHPRAASVMVAFIENGCVWTTGIMPRALFFAMARRVPSARDQSPARLPARRGGV